MMIKHPITVISQGQKKSSSWYGNSGANSITVVVTVVMEMVYIHTQIVQTLSSCFFS